jgi:hypothetical protein
LGIINFGQFFEITKIGHILRLFSSMVKGCALILTKIGLAIFGAIFSQTHPVTQQPSIKLRLLVRKGAKYFAGFRLGGKNGDSTVLLLFSTLATISLPMLFFQLEVGRASL